MFSLDLKDNSTVGFSDGYAFTKRKNGREHSFIFHPLVSRLIRTYGSACETFGSNRFVIRGDGFELVGSVNKRTELLHMELVSAPVPPDIFPAMREIFALSMHRVVYVFGETPFMYTYGLSLIGLPELFLPVMGHYEVAWLALNAIVEEFITSEKMEWTQELFGYPVTVQAQMADDGALTPYGFWTLRDMFSQRVRTDVFNGAILRLSATIDEADEDAVIFADELFGEGMRQV